MPDFSLTIPLLSFEKLTILEKQKANGYKIAPSTMPEIHTIMQCNVHNSFLPPAHPLLAPLPQFPTRKTQDIKNQAALFVQASWLDPWWI